MTDSSAHLEEKQKQNNPWYKDLTTLISLAAMLIALLSAGASAYLANKANGVAEQQAVGAEQQQLISLVANIAQVPATIAQESVTFNGNPAAFHDAEVGTQLTELADSEAAVSIISLLHHNGVTAVEYYYVAVGLQAGGSDADALRLLGIAATLPADPRTRANILRTEAQIFYQLGRVSKAEHDVKLAEQAFAVPDVTSEDYSFNMAYTKLFDAQYQAQISCSIAQAEVAAAIKILKTIPNIPAIVNQEAAAESRLKAAKVTGKCTNPPPPRPTPVGAPAPPPSEPPPFGR
jgi:hypothetical protein